MLLAALVWLVCVVATPSGAAEPGELPHALSAAELRTYLAGHPQERSYTAGANPVIALLNSARPGQGPRAAAARLAQLWSIPAETADAVLELVVLDPDSSRGRERAQLRRRHEDAIARIVHAATPSKEAWRVVLWRLDQQEKCQNEGIRSAYFSQPWAISDLLHSPDRRCSQWLSLIPARAPVTPLLLARIAASAPTDGRDELLAFRTFRDALVRAGLPPSDPVRLYAQRRYFLALAERGLWSTLLTEAHRLSPQELGTVLQAPTDDGTVVLDGVDLERPAYVQYTARLLRPAWLLALTAAGEAQEAREWLQRWHWNGPEDLPAGRDVDDREHEAEDLTLRLITDSPGEDAFDVFVEHGYLLSDPLLTSPGARRLALAYLQAHDYPELAAYLRSRPCDTGDDAGSHPVPWDSFPDAVRTAAAELAGELAAISREGCAPNSAREDDAAGLRARPELSLPPALRWVGPRPDSPRIPAAARKALSAFNIVRYSAGGDSAAAISLSQDVDPVGEVSGGGYWLHLSGDGGRTWQAPLYLGLQQFEPYAVVARSHLPLIKGRMLQIEVEVQELDPASITLPPIGLSARRAARDLYIELPLDEIERDSDGDGLTDLLEAKLGTDPHERDTDHDGLEDGVDPLPQVSATAPAFPDAEVMRMALQSVVGFDAGAIGTPAPRPEGQEITVDEQLAAMVEGRARPGDQRTVFLVGEQAQFQGLTVPGRVIILTEDQARAMRRRYGIFYPLELHVWFNHARTKAFLLWDARWVGGASRFTKKDGRWQPPERIRDWIT